MSDINTDVFKRLCASTVSFLNRIQLSPAEIQLFMACQGVLSEIANNTLLADLRRPDSQDS